MIHTSESRQIFRIMGKLRPKVSRKQRLRVLSWINSREVESVGKLTPFELQVTAGVLYSWDAAGHLEAQVAEILSGRAEAA